MSRLRRLLASFTLIAGACVAPVTHAAEPYPNRAIRAVIPFPAGGINDTIGRLLFKHLADTMPANIVVENKPGAGGTIGTLNAINSPTDGYTLLLGAASTIAVAPNLYKDVGYTAEKNLIAVGGIAAVPSVVIVAEQSPYKKWADLIAADKAKPGSLNYGSAGSGTSHHVQAELLNLRAGTKFMHVPYKGGAPAMTDLIGGQLDLLVDPLPTTLANVKAGRVRALAVTTDTRVPELPDVPTLKELGLDYNASTWFGLFVPAGTPPDAVAKLGTALHAALADPTLQADFRSRGIAPLTMDAPAFTAYVRDEDRTWRDVITQAGIQVQ